MQAEEAVEINHVFAWNIDAWPHRIVLGLGVRHDDVEPVGCATLEDHHQTLVARAFDRAESCARKEARHRGGSDDRECAVAKEYATGCISSSWLLSPGFHLELHRL